MVCCNQPESGMHSTYILLQNLLSDSIQLSKPVLSPWASPCHCISPDSSAGAGMERDGWVLESAMLWEWSWTPLWEQREEENTSFLTSGCEFHTCGAEKMLNPARDILQDTQDTWKTQRAARPLRSPGAPRAKQQLRLKCNFGSLLMFVLHRLNSPQQCTENIPGQGSRAGSPSAGTSSKCIF